MSSKATKITSVQDFYKGADILITGATGFIGLVLIEKLLRSCPDLNRIYAVVRPKRGKSVQDRRGVFADCELFEHLLQLNPKALDKLELIDGDISLPGLGISAINRKRLENVSIVFHSAASIRFDEPLKEAILGHVRGTRDLLDLVTSFKKIRAFVHVSTAYCNMDNGSLDQIKENRLEEVLYPDVDDWRNVIKLAENVDQGTLNVLTKHFTKFYLNTYLYTKALSENVCKAYQAKIPIVIYRPSIVLSKAIPPLNGWTNNLNGPYGLCLAGLMGVLRIIYGDANTAWDVIPVDVTVNGMIISACKRHVIDEETAIYNSNMEKTSFVDVTRASKLFEREISPSNTIWRPNVGCTRCKFNFQLQALLFHMLPAILIDTGLKLMHKQPRLQRVQQKVHNVQKALVHFMKNTFEIRNYNFTHMDDSLCEEDKQIFDIKIKEVAPYRDRFSQNAMHCIRKFILKDPDDTLEAARKNYDRLVLADNVIRTLFWGTLAFYYCNWVAALAF